MFPRNILYYGKEEPLPFQIPLRAGPLSLIYEEGDLRHIRLGQREILRRVYFALRDHTWGTVPHRLSNARTNIRDDAFEITFDADNRTGEVDFSWRGQIVGDPQGRISFSLEGEARSTFLRTRIGLCVLHPIRECAGALARILHTDGTTTETQFPQHIAPQHIVNGEVKPVPPFAEMAAMSHEALPHVWAEILFSGDVFEMEDQRNWLDASYKTYCPPLRLPWPSEIKRGMKVVQAITLTLNGTAPPSMNTERNAAITFMTAVSPPRPMPRLGLGCASHSQPLSGKDIERLQALQLSHLRVDLWLSQPGYDVALRRAWTEAQALGLALEAALFVSDSAAEELKALLGLLDQIKPRINQWLVFHIKERATSGRWIALARETLRGYDSDALLGSGTDLFFADLNRQRPTGSLPDLITYSLVPQVHAFDNASMVEGLEAIPATVESARQFIGAAQLAISTITFKRRYSSHRIAPEPTPAPNEMPPQVDERQMSLFGAGWTAGCLKHLAESGADSATFYQTTGWRGVMEMEGGSPVPERFRSLPGSVFPLYHVLADMGEFANGEVIPSRSSDPLKVEGLILRKADRVCHLLANLSPLRQRVVLQDLGERVRVRKLDETNVIEAMQFPEMFRAVAGEAIPVSNGRLELKLLPYAIIRIDRM